MMRSKEEEAADAGARWEKAKEHPKAMTNDEKKDAVQKFFDKGETLPSGIDFNTELPLDALKITDNHNVETPALEAPVPSYITIDDLDKVEIRLGTVITAVAVPKSKLLNLTVDFGEATSRTVLAGIAKCFTPEHLVGKQFAFVTNLPPREMKGIMSQAMILAAGPPEALTLCSVSPPGVAGARFQ